MPTPTLDAHLTTVSTGAVNSLTVDRVTGITEDDHLFILIGSDDSAAPDRFQELSGWVKEFEVGGLNPACHLALYTRKADGTEAATETIDHTTNDDIWAVYGRITAGERYFVLPGEEDQTAAAASLQIGGLWSKDPALAFYGLAFDGADADFSVSAGTGWTETAEIKRGTLPSGASGCFGTKDIESGVARLTGPVTIDSTVNDGMVGIQWIWVRGSQNQWAYRAIKRLRENHPPDATGWSTAAESTWVRRLIRNAQADVGMRLRTDFSRDVRNIVASRIDANLASSGSNPDEREINATSVQMEAAFVAAESYFQTEAAEDALDTN